MDISAALAPDLTILNQILDDPETDLESALSALVVDVKRAIASFTGLTMTIPIPGSDVSVSVHELDVPARQTSLLLPLSVAGAGVGEHSDSAVLLYAAAPGAFVDLAADLSFALGIDPDELVLDDNVDATGTTVDPTAGAHSVAQYMTINQAIGILVARGHTLETAREELLRLASCDQRRMPAAAEALVTGVAGGAGSGDRPAPTTWAS